MARGKDPLLPVCDELSDGECNALAGAIAPPPLDEEPPPPPPSTIITPGDPDLS